jgi:hypothetical protein
MPFDFDSEVVPLVKIRGKAVLSNREQRDDALSVAWELWLQNPEAPPPGIAYYACKRVRVDRQFRESISSVTGPASPDKVKPERVLLTAEHLLRETDDPAELVAVKLDFADWLRNLTDREKGFLEEFLQHERTTDIARRWNVTQARVSQIRRELLSYWIEFTS